MWFCVEDLKVPLLFAVFMVLLHSGYRLYLKIKGRRYDKYKVDPLVPLSQMFLAWMLAFQAGWLFF